MATTFVKKVASLTRDPYDCRGKGAFSFLRPFAQKAFEEDGLEMEEWEITEVPLVDAKSNDYVCKVGVVLENPAFQNAIVLYFDEYGELVLCVAEDALCCEREFITVLDALRFLEGEVAA